MPVNYFYLLLLSVIVGSCKSSGSIVNSNDKISTRERISINEGWKFYRYDTAPDKLIYDVRPEVTDRNDNIVADTKPTESVTLNSSDKVLKNWILPSANDFISDTTKQHRRPSGNPGADFPFVQSNFNDAGWESVNL